MIASTQCLTFFLEDHPVVDLTSGNHVNAAISTGSATANHEEEAVPSSLLMMPSDAFMFDDANLGAFEDIPAEGTSSTALQPSSVAKGTALSALQGICVICQDGPLVDQMVGHGVSVAALDCGHLFHHRCINEVKAKMTGCPICKAPFSRGSHA